MATKLNAQMASQRRPLHSIDQNIRVARGGQGLHRPISAKKVTRRASRQAPVIPTIPESSAADEIQMVKRHLAHIESDNKQLRQRLFASAADRLLSGMERERAPRPFHGSCKGEVAERSSATELVGPSRKRPGELHLAPAVVPSHRSSPPIGWAGVRIEGGVVLPIRPERPLVRLRSGAHSQRGGVFVFVFRRVGRTR
jgi:hypothetical protein